MPTAKPFHETIIDAIGRCSSPSSGEILNLFQLIQETVIPKGHDEIADAIRHYFISFNSSMWPRETAAVKKHLALQKSEREARTRPTRR